MTLKTVARDKPGDDGRGWPKDKPGDADDGTMRSRAVSIFVESALFFLVPHFLTANRIHFAEKCS